MTPDDRALAAELVLGLLDDAEHAAARARVLADAAFAAEVSRWQAWLMPLATGWPDEPPPPRLEPRVMAAIEEPIAGRGGRGRVVLYAALAVAAAVLALVLGPLHAPAPVPPPSRPAPERATLLAALSVPADQQAEGRVALAATVDPASGVVRVSTVAGLPPRRSAELWAIGADGRPPVSLGLLSGEGASRITVAATARRLLVPGTTLAVSVEPVGGSRTGAPTGPVVAAGALARG